MATENPANQYAGYANDIVLPFLRETLKPTVNIITMRAGDHSFYGRIIDGEERDNNTKRLGLIEVLGEGSRVSLNIFKLNDDTPVVHTVGYTGGWALPQHRPEESFRNGLDTARIMGNFQGMKKALD